MDKGCKEMELLEERIRKDGIVKEGNVLKVDNFLNHQMDIELFDEMGKNLSVCLLTNRSTRFLRLKHRESELPVSWQDIFMCR